jgi:hypothetical protein
MRMQIEALRPKTLIDAYDAIFKLGPREGGFSMVLFDGELRSGTEWLETAWNYP